MFLLKRWLVFQLGDFQSFNRCVERVLPSYRGAGSKVGDSQSLGFHGLRADEAVVERRHVFLSLMAGKRHFCHVADVGRPRTFAVASESLGGEVACIVLALNAFQSAVKTDRKMELQPADRKMTFYSCESRLAW